MTGGRSRSARVVRATLVPLALATIAACSSAPARSHPTSDPPSTIARCPAARARAAGSGGLPGITLHCLGTGPDVDLAQLRGPALVSLWASWCYPCRQEMPLLQSTAESQRGTVRVVGVDTNDHSAAAVRFARRTVHATYEQLADPSGRLATALGAPGLPYTIAIDSAGAITWRKAGKLTRGDIRDAVKAATQGGSP